MSRSPFASRLMNSPPKWKPRRLGWLMWRRPSPVPRERSIVTVTNWSLRRKTPRTARRPATTYRRSWTPPQVKSAPSPLSLQECSRGKPTPPPSSSMDISARWRPWRDDLAARSVSDGTTNVWTVRRVHVASWTNILNSEAFASLVNFDIKCNCHEL